MPNLQRNAFTRVPFHHSSAHHWGRENFTWQWWCGWMVSENLLWKVRITFAEVVRQCNLRHWWATTLSDSELHKAFSHKSQTHWKFVYVNSIEQRWPQTISTGCLLQMIVESIYGVAHGALRTQHIALHDQIPCTQWYPSWRVPGSNCTADGWVVECK